MSFSEENDNFAINDYSIKSDQYRFDRKDIVSLKKQNCENLKSLEVFKKYVELTAKNPEDDTLEYKKETNGLIQILGQNLKTDHKVYLIICVNPYEENANIQKVELSTIKFGGIFKSCVTKILAENKYDENISENSSEHLTKISHLLDELKNEQVEHLQSFQIHKSKERTSTVNNNHKKRKTHVKKVV